MEKFSPAKLLHWYRRNKRDLPWRKTHDPYKILVSEIMLQQTQVSRVLHFYEKFVKKFPTVEFLAAATWPQVLPFVRGLGYYRRFRNLLRAAKKISKKFDGKIPSDYQVLRTLPGIGEYTANALLAFAFGEHVPVIDTNVRQVFQHFFKPKTSDAVKTLALKLCPKGKARDFFQAVMDYAKQNKILPRVSHRSLRSLRVSLRVPAAIIHRNGKILIQQRQRQKHLAGFWEFPGGKLQANEDERTCLKREIKEELGIEVAVRPPFFKVNHTYSDRRVRLSFHRCSILLGNPVAREGQKFLWVPPQEFKKYRFAPADRPVLKALQKS